MRTGYRANDRNEYADDYKSAKDMLAMLAKGEIKLTDTAGSELPQIVSAKMHGNKSDYAPVFDMDDEQSWGVDSAELDDIAKLRK